MKTTAMIGVSRRVGRGNNRRGSVLLVSVVLVVVAGFAALAWLNFIHHVQRSAERDRQRMQAFYAAEAGVEQVVDYLNTPSHYTGSIPEDYDTEATQPNVYPLVHPAVAPEAYPLFQPYIVSYEIDSEGNPVYRDGLLVTTRMTFFQNLNAGTAQEISKTSKIPTCQLNISGSQLLVFKNDEGREMARVKEIRLVHPIDIEKIEGSLPDDIRIITKVVATGVTPSGVSVQLESLITENPTYNLRSPGAIISNASVDYAGNFNVHWGQVWAEGPIVLPSNFTVKLPRYDDHFTYKEGNPTYDKWFKMRTEGWIKDPSDTEYANGMMESGFSAVTSIPGTSVYTVPYDPDYLYRSKGKSDFEGLENLEQNQELDFPDYNYADWKAFVTSYGFPYYFTDEDGTLYGVDTDPTSATYGKTIGQDFDTWFRCDPGDPDYYNIEKMIVFIDSVPTNDKGEITARNDDGVPIINSQFYPRDPVNSGGYMCTLSISGNGLHTRGAMFIAANMDMPGMGKTASWKDIPEVLMPNGDRPAPGTRMDIFHNGLLYCWGKVSTGGQRVIYGSIFAEKGYDSNGDPEVFYNYKMADGSWLNLNVSRVNRILWNYNTYDLSKLD